MAKIRREAMTTILKLGPSDHGRPLSPEEFYLANWQSGYRYELIHGRLYVSPVPDLPQNWLELWLFGKLNLYVLERPEIINFVTNKARVFVPDEPEATQPEPDLAAYESFPRDIPIAQMDWRSVSPLLVVEVVGENDPEKDLERNVELYLQVPSIREYWVLDPRLDADNPTLLVYRKRGQRWQRLIEVSSGEMYTTRLLPGFSLRVDPRS
jgi:Uma2 family endonuclease